MALDGEGMIFNPECGDMLLGQGLAVSPSHLTSSTYLPNVPSKTKGKK